MLKISIITITYNSEDTIEQTLQSVIEQSYPNIEYIVVDGKSNDNTLKILETYKSHIQVLLSEKDSGLYDALNKGIALASGDVIGFLHSDDFYVNNAVIQKYADTFLAGDYDAVYSDLFYVDKTDSNKIIRKWKSGLYKKGMFLNGWMPPHPTFFVKKKVYEAYGHFNLDFKTAADYELMLRFIHKHRIRLGYLPEFTVNMRVGGKSNVSLKNRIIANLEDRRAWKINGLTPRFYTLYVKPLRKILQFF